MKIFNKSISNAIKFLNDIGQLMQAGSPISLNASSDFKKIARSATTYQEVYDAGIKLQQFNVQIKDKSYFQFTMEQGNDEIRLAYYPYPYKYIEFNNQKKMEEELLNEGYSLEDIEQLISEDYLSYDIPYIRLDISKAQYCPNFHPFAHLHIGFHVENRWPVRRRLSPFAFVLFILNHYYPSICKKLIDNRECNILELYQNEVEKCAILEEEFFQPHQQKRLHFT